MDHIELNGTSLRYDISGVSGPPLVLIHEMGGMIENWDLVVPHLADRYAILRYDSRGCGLSAKIRRPLSVEMLSDDLSALLDAVGIREPVAIASCALGSATAFAFAARFPARTAAVRVDTPSFALICTRWRATVRSLMNSRSPMSRFRRPSARWARLENILRDGMAAIVDGAMASGYPEILRKRDPERYRAFRARWLGNDPDSFVAQYRLLIDMDIAHYVR